MSTQAVVTTVPDTGSALVDSLTWGSRWITPGSPMTEIAVGYYPALYGGYGPNTAELAAIQSVLNLVESYINVNFSFVGADAGGTLSDIRYVISRDDGSGDYGFAVPPGEDPESAAVFGHDLSDVVVFRDNYEGKNGALKPGGFDYITFIHEFGHALGLAHPHDNGGTATDPSLIFLGVTDPFGSYGDFHLNQGVFTTMSYNDGWETGPYIAHPASYGFQSTFMALDVLALQAIYGANESFASGDDTYLMPASKKVGVGYACIWDTGGIDTISASSKAAALIDLRAATGLVDDGGGGRVCYTTGVPGGYTIAAGAVIENATGGGKGDILIGNEFDNILKGLAGADFMTGGLGHDTFVFTQIKDTGLTLLKADVITDFEHGVDLIDVHGIDANAKLAGLQDFVFDGQAASFSGAGALRYGFVNGDTIVFGNTDMDAAVEFEIRLTGIHNLSEIDFIV